MPTTEALSRVGANGSIAALVWEQVDSYARKRYPQLSDGDLTNYETIVRYRSPIPDGWLVVERPNGAPPGSREIVHFVPDPAHQWR